MNNFLRPLFVAEMTINHLGMHKIAIATMESLKNIGVNYIKFKMKDVSQYYEKSDKTFNGYPFNLYRGSLEICDEGFDQINEWCANNDMNWFATIHDKLSLERLSKYNPPFYKLASMDALNSGLLNDILTIKPINTPVIVSIGGLSYDKIDKIVENVISTKSPLILLHTVSIYPTPIEKSNISRIEVLRNRYEQYDVKVGYSGHEVGYAASLLAVNAKAYMIERHVTLSKNLNIHHIDAAISIDEYKELINLTDQIVTIKNSEEVEYFNEEHKFLLNKEYT